jgi:GNAT superfamily N-acetyltransferase
MKKDADSLTINEVNAETFDDFLGLIVKLAEYEKLMPPNDGAKERLRADCLSANPRYKAFMGKIGETSVSYVIYFFTYSSFLALPTLFIEDIFVLEEYRRRGIGQVMFNSCKEIANREGCGRIEFTVLKWNKSAQEFYNKNKAKNLEEWFFYRLVREDF